MSSDLVPADVDTDLVAPFLSLTLTLLDLVAQDPVVKQYTSTGADARQVIRALSTSVGAAGVRVRDSRRGRDDYEDHLRLFTDEEIWLCDLAIDVVAMLGTLDGVGHGTRGMIVSDLRTLDESVHGHHWKKAVHKAGDGPPAFRELRANVAHHPPHPAR